MAGRYLNQCWLIGNWTIGNKFQWNLNRNTTIFFTNIAFINIVCKMAAILFRYRCYNGINCGRIQSLRGSTFQSNSQGSTQLCSDPIQTKPTPVKVPDNWRDFEYLYGLDTRGPFYWQILTIWWRHQLATFAALLVLCAGIHRSPVNSLHKGKWRRALMFSLPE